MKEMQVKCGSLKWRGKCASADQAIQTALSRRLPQQPAILLRVFDGMRWQYIEFKSALKIAGYTIKNMRNGFMVK